MTDQEILGEGDFVLLVPYELIIPLELGGKNYIPCVQEVVTPFYIVTYYIKSVTTSWTHST